MHIRDPPDIVTVSLVGSNMSYLLCEGDCISWLTFYLCSTSLLYRLVVTHNNSIS